MQITEKKTFVITQPLEEPHTCLFLNRLGVFEQIQLTKYRVEKLDTDPQYFGSVDHQRTRTVLASTSLSYFTQWYGMEYYEWLKDLILSPEIYVDGKYVKITSTSYTYDNTEQLFSIELKVLHKYSENVLSV